MKNQKSLKVGYDKRKIEILTLIDMYKEITRDHLNYLWRISNPGNKSDFLSILRRYIRNGLIGVKEVYFTPAKGKKGRGRRKINCKYYLTEKGTARLKYLIYKINKEKKQNGTSIL